MGRFGMGQPVRRVEDRRFLTGHGKYTADMNFPGQAHAVIVRAGEAHGRLNALDVEEARQAPGVLGVYTIADLDADGLGDLPCLVSLKNRDGSPQAKPSRPVLARDKIRHSGEALALVVAESEDLARDAAELVMPDCEELPAVTTAEAALSPDAPLLHDSAPGNLCFDWQTGDEDATEAAFTAAAHVTELELVNSRVIVCSMEPRAAIGLYDPARERISLYTSSQGVHQLRTALSKVMNLPEDRLHVVTPDVGGGFGMKIFLYPEHVLVAWAARKLRRPVKWVAERSNDAFLSDTQGRDHVTRAAIALDDQGKLLGLRVETLANLGASLSTFAPYVATAGGIPMLNGLYDLPAACVRVKGVLTNTVPVDAYRGAGRPEAIYVIERLMDEAALQLGLDPAELRRRNFIRPDQLPYKTVFGENYDSGEFAALMDHALVKAGWDKREERRADAARRGRLFGMGMASYVECCAGGSAELASLRFEPDGSLIMTIGTQSNGQGHETAYAQMLAGQLGIEMDKITVRQGDTDQIAWGNGTGGSRSVPVGGAALAEAGKVLIDKGRPIAAHHLDTAPEELDFADGWYQAGGNKSVSLVEVAKLSFKPGKIPDGTEPQLQASATWKPPQKTYPNGCHIASVEIEPDTGEVFLIDYTVVDDFGDVVNPALVLGQVQGGIAQGLGQVLMENTVYDPDSGQLLSGSFMDYGLPRARDLVEIDFETRNVPCKTNALGLKGCGEAGTIGACPALMNALLDAVRPAGVTELQMPVTPLALWTALHRAGKAA